MVSGKDILTYLLEDEEYFAKDEVRICDTLLELFFAATTTITDTTQMLFVHLIQKSDCRAKARAEYQTGIIDRYLKEDASEEEKSGAKEVDQLKALSYERLWDLEYYQCFQQEALRYHTVSPQSTRHIVT